MTGESFFKNEIAMRVSREMALDFGLVEPTGAERERRDAEMREWRAKKAAEQPRLHASLAALDALDGLARAVLDLHNFKRDERHWRTCEGCDYAGFEGDPPDWPCRTVELIAGREGVDLRNFHLYEPEGSNA